RTRPRRMASIPGCRRLLASRQGRRADALCRDSSRYRRAAQPRYLGILVGTGHSAIREGDPLARRPVVAACALVVAADRRTVVETACHVRCRRLDAGAAVLSRRGHVPATPDGWQALRVLSGARSGLPSMERADGLQAR